MVMCAGGMRFTGRVEILRRAMACCTAFKCCVLWWVWGYVVLRGRFGMMGATRHGWMGGRIGVWVGLCVGGTKYEYRWGWDVLVKCLLGGREVCTRRWWYYWGAATAVMGHMKGDTEVAVSCRLDLFDSCCCD
jgi:hypothetical protein